jgi:hypothetical protein
LRPSADRGCCGFEQQNEREDGRSEAMPESARRAHVDSSRCRSIRVPSALGDLPPQPRPPAARVNGSFVLRAEDFSRAFYCYDAHNRVVATRSAAGCSAGLLEAYTYDDAGNRLTAGTVTFSYDATGQLTGCAPSCGTVAHDAAGRLQRWNGWFFEYDAEGRMLWACQSSSACTGGLYTEVGFTYDGEGHRTQLRTYASGSSTPTATWDFGYQGEALVEERLNGTVVRTYVVDAAP